MSNVDLLESSVTAYFKEHEQQPYVVSFNREIDSKVLKKQFQGIKRENRPNLYALVIKKQNCENWKIKYIGQRKSEGILQRLRVHLFKKDKRTGSKLKEIQKELAKGSQVGIILYKISPEKLREYYEKILIEELNPEWNDHEK